MKDPENGGAIYGVANLIKDVVAEGGCIPIDYEFLVDFDSEIELDSQTAQLGIRQITYLQCLQLGWFHSSDSLLQPFGNRFPVETFHQFCTDVFGES